MNDYDKASRYLAKRDAAGFKHWLLDKPEFVFRAWIDARRAALPNQGDLTNDLVAALQNGKRFEGVCIEFEVKARAHAVDRLLMYLARLWTEPGDGNSLPLSCVCGVIVDLTGSSPACDLTLHSAAAPGCRLELTVLRRNLAGEDGKALIARVASGEVSAWQLGWVPLMRGGNESAIIIQWRKQAEAHLTDEVHRADMGSLVLTFATLAGCRPAWDRGLKGWNMETSPFLDEIRAQGREIGRQEGRAEEARAMVMRFGRRKFGKGPTRKQQAALGAITDLDQLEQLADRVLLVDSWSNLLNGHTIS